MNSYGKLCTQYYDLDKTQPPTETLAWILDQAKKTGGPLLEPMCGSGRFLLPLAQAGYQITGVDASPEMLAACRRKALKLGVKPALFEQVLHQMALPHTYALVLIPSGSFGLITDLNEAREGLRRIFAHTRPGGHVLLECDQMVIEPNLPLGPTPSEHKVTRKDGTEIRLITMARYDPHEHISHAVNRYQLWSQEGLLEEEFEHLDLRYYTPPQLNGLLEAAGLRVIETQPADRSRTALEKAESFLTTAVKP